MFRVSLHFTNYVPQYSASVCILLMLFRSVPQHSALFRSILRCSAMFRVVPQCSALVCILLYAVQNCQRTYCIDLRRHQSDEFLYWSVSVLASLFICINYSIICWPNPKTLTSRTTLQARLFGKVKFLLSPQKNFEIWW